jgi:transcriptional regulator with XRE-family HTH domain
VTGDRYLTSAKQLREAREAAGLTQAEVEAKSGISRNVLSGMENGRRGIGRRSAARLAKALNVEPETLLSDPPLTPAQQRERETLLARVAELEARVNRLEEG